MVSITQLDTYLASNSYLGGHNATLYDHKMYAQINDLNIALAVVPHLQRWYSHISFLIGRYGSRFDCFGRPLSPGKVPAVFIIPCAALSKMPSPKRKAAIIDGHLKFDPIIEAAWKELQEKAPVPISAKPTFDQIEGLKAHKHKVNAFLAGFSVEIARALRCKHQLEKHLDKQQQRQSQQPVSLLARDGTFTMVPRTEPVSIWDGTPPVIFTHVLPFYSHTQRSKDFELIDSRIGVDRRVFSNLFTEPDGQLYRVERAPESMGGEKLMRHAFLTEVPATSSEAFFQAAKCELEADAHFILELSPLHAAKYGQGRLDLNPAQAERLGELGLKVEMGLDCPNPTYARGHANAGALRRLPPIRSDWEMVKMDVMMHVCRNKFLSTSASPVSTVAARSLAALAASEHSWLLVEHPKVGGDAKWGDGGDGNGFNLLGKCLSRIIIEAKGADVAERLTSFSKVRAFSNTMIDYKR